MRKIDEQFIAILAKWTPHYRETLYFDPMIFIRM